MTPRMWGYVVAILVVFATHWGAYSFGHSVATTAEKKEAATAAAAASAAALKQVNEARAAEQAAQAKLNAAADKHEKDKADALAVAARTTDDLRTDNRRLRSYWQGCQATSRVSGAAASAAEPDAEAELRNASAGRIVGAGAEADRWIERLQEAVRVYEAQGRAK